MCDLEERQRKKESDESERVHGEDLRTRVSGSRAGVKSTSAHLAITLTTRRVFASSPALGPRSLFLCHRLLSYSPHTLFHHAGRKGPKACLQQ